MGRRATMGLSAMVRPRLQRRFLRAARSAPVAFHELVLAVLWLMLPAYVANMSPVVAAKIVPRWKAPLDGGRVARDGKPVLGASKTWRGLVFGALAGGVTAVIQSRLAGGAWRDDFGRGVLVRGPDVEMAGGYFVPLALGVAMGAGALLGDAVKSYFKRRRDLKPGAPWIGFDQLDFVVGSLLFAWAMGGLLLALGLQEQNWFVDRFVDHPSRLVLAVLLTPGLHLVVNWIGYKMRLKKVPW